MGLFRNVHRHTNLRIKPVKHIAVFDLSNIVLSAPSHFNFNLLLDSILQLESLEVHVVTSFPTPCPPKQWAWLKFIASHPGVVLHSFPLRHENNSEHRVVDERVKRITYLAGRSPACCSVLIFGGDHAYAREAFYASENGKHVRVFGWSGSISQQLKRIATSVSLLDETLTPCLLAA